MQRLTLALIQKLQVKTTSQILKKTKITFEIL